MPLNGGSFYGQWGDPSVIPPNTGYNRSIAGVTVNERTAMGLMSAHSCIRIIGDSIANLDVHTYDRQGSANPQNWKEVDTPDSVYNPYPDMDAEDGNFRQIASLGLAGNLYRHVLDRDKYGLPCLVDVLNAGVLRVSMEAGLKTYRIGNGPALDPADIIHVPWIALAGGVVGLNPIEFGAQGLGIALATQEYAGRYYSQGMHPTGVLSVKRPVAKGDAKKLQQELMIEHGGLAQSHTPIVLDAETSWTQISITPETAQLLSSREFSRQEIAGFYGVPMYLLNDQASRGGTWVRGLQEMIIGFALFALNGYARRLDRADTKMLRPGFVCRRKVSDLFKTNDQMLAMFLSALRNSSLITPNEGRPYIGLEPSDEEGADSLFAPLNSAQSDWMSPNGDAVPAAGAPGGPDDVYDGGGDPQ